eukprot:CAMPEP_0183296644 /NCGR_PEP_ID=MMETSP0160_2-20130417/4105_1 /TAXON_ID=2839 ORGANISM="Odontella Sinensis, Strain Grunow 1884" /NCGR_SAMPLE_ID=MMETSP0160_2 /ASSEMBLY_ACC=CAM_ASM_000250 /LENGTH=204 /DNA_ID=CAMNT_0025458277 /DNA_START=439 /DNA_END=1049 /DNA_ORIENTATION=-
MPSKSRPSPFSQRSAFDEALSKPLVRSVDGDDDRPKSAASGAAARRLPPTKTAAVELQTGPFPGYRPPSAVPSSASSVVSSDDESAPAAQKRGGGAFPVSFDPALSAAFESPAENDGDGRHETERRELLQDASLRQQTDLDVALLRERRDELAGVTRSMGLVAEIQRDLANLVQSQQSDVDDVETNAAETAAAAERGLDHLERA